MAKNGPLTPRRILSFWIPLAAMWLIMSIEQPSLTAVVSRLPAATENLAAFGLTFSFALLIESPVIMLLTAGTALSRHRQAYERLMQFTHLLAVSLTALHLLFALTPLYAFVLRDLIGAPEPIIETSRVAFLLMLPWTAAIAYRRLWEGVMIRYEHPRKVTLVIIARIAVTILVLVGGLVWGGLPGASVGALSLSVGVMVGAITAYALARSTIRDEIPTPGPTSRPLDWRRLSSFYSPLALTSFITMIGMPLLSFGIARAPRPLESLAIWPVVMALLFIGRSLGIAYQEVVVTLLRDEQSYAALRRFALWLAAGATALFALLVLTPGAALWYRHVSGLEPGLVELAILPTAIMAVVPGLNALISWQRGILVAREETGPISIAVALNLALLLLAMFGGPLWFALPGAQLAAAALSGSLLVEFLYLTRATRGAAVGLEAVRAAAGD